MKKKKRLNLVLNKRKVSELNKIAQNSLVGGGNTYQGGNGCQGSGGGPGSGGTHTAYCGATGSCATDACSNYCQTNYYLC